MPGNDPYNRPHLDVPAETQMPRRIANGPTGFGARLAALRKAAGYTQAELAEELGISQRMVAYYEGQTEHAPAALLPAIAKALRVTTDELLGVASMRKASRPSNSRLQRRMQQIEKLDARTKRQVMQLLDTFIANQKLRQKVEGKQPA
jgi:transcriptional regulator with XRE-family HTH domain